MSIVPVQTNLPGIEVSRRAVTPMDLLESMIGKADSIDPTAFATAIEKLKAMHDDERRYQAEVAFDDALNACQASIGRIAPNNPRADTHSKWADYAQIDRVIRPIYTLQGFSIAFSEVAPIQVGKVRIKATLSRSGVSKDYFSEITPSTTGPKGNVMATPTDADAIAQSRAKRYLVLSIFNIAVGIDTEEKVGVPAQPTEDQEAKLQDWADSLRQAPDLPALKGVFADAYSFAKRVGNDPMREMTRVYEERKCHFLGGAR